LLVSFGLKNFELFSAENDATVIGSKPGSKMINKPLIVMLISLISDIIFAISHQSQSILKKVVKFKKSLLTILVIFLSFETFANSLSIQVSAYDDEHIVSAFGTTNITEEFTVEAEMDSTGYLALGAGYGDILGQWYVEGFVNYGRADLIDIYDLGGMTATSLTEKFTIFYLGYHQWRRTKGLPAAIGFNIFDSREWKNTLGISYEPINWLEISISASHDRLLSGHWLIADVENDNVNSQDLTLKYKSKWGAPFVRYRTGEYRVRPGEPITKDNTVELGLSFSF